MHITPALLSINFGVGRSGNQRPDVITIHVTEGSAASVRAWFNDPASKVSSHYMVTRDGGIEQFVEEKDTAWVNGRVFVPTAAIVLERPGINPNSYSIGIEHEGAGTDELTAPQREASVWLIRSIASRRKIPMTRRHIIGHREIYAKKTCPGKIDVDRLVREAAGSAVTIEPVTFSPHVVWSDYAGEYLIVTESTTDTDWAYVRMADLVALPRTRSTVSLRAMLRARPA